MKIQIEIPDQNIDNALAAPHSRYWASEAGWDPKGRTGYVVDALAAVGEPRRYEFAADAIVRALQVMGEFGLAAFGHVCDDRADGPDGDTLLQYTVFGELKYG